MASQVSINQIKPIEQQRKSQENLTRMSCGSQKRSSSLEKRSDSVEKPGTS